MIRRFVGAVAIAAFLSVGVATGALAQKANPCAAKNPCGARNPCAAAMKVDPKLITRPAGTKLAAGKRADLISEGERLWKDAKLGTNGLSCETCHRGFASFNAGFAKPYPHPVAMVSEQAGLKQIHMDEMVQICLVAPMQSKPLPWDSRALAALTAYTGKIQQQFRAAAAKPGGVNPCAAKNPCAVKNPCAAKNPCQPKK